MGKVGSKTTLTGAAYDVSQFKEEHRMFTFRIPLSDRFLDELQGFYDRYGLATRFRTEMRTKWKVNNRVQLFSGIHTESIIGGSPENREVPGSELLEEWNTGYGKTFGLTPEQIFNLIMYLPVFMGNF